MGANKTIKLTRVPSIEELESMFDELDMRDSIFLHVKWSRWNEGNWSEDWKGWKTAMDIELVSDVLMFHYGYWGQKHEERCKRVSRILTRRLTKMGLVKRNGRWGY